MTCFSRLGSFFRPEEPFRRSQVTVPPPQPPEYPLHLKLPGMPPFMKRNPERACAAASASNRPSALRLRSLQVRNPDSRIAAPLMSSSTERPRRHFRANPVRSSSLKSGPDCLGGTVVSTEALCRTPQPCRRLFQCRVHHAAHPLQGRKVARFENIRFVREQLENTDHCRLPAEAASPPRIESPTLHNFRDLRAHR